MGEKRAESIVNDTKRSRRADGLWTKKRCLLGLVFAFSLGSVVHDYRRTSYDFGPRLLNTEQYTTLLHEAATYYDLTELALTRRGILEDEEEDRTESGSKFERGGHDADQPKMKANARQHIQPNTPLARIPDLKFPSHYCQWAANGTLLPCKHQLLETFPSIRNASHWYFIGDSTVARMSTSFPKDFSDQFERIRNGKQKNKMLYYSNVPAMKSLIPADDPILANPTLGEGPFPVERTEETGCTTCRNGLYRQRQNYTTANSPPLACEFLAMEHCKDRTFQTKQTSTSQETMVLYMDLSNETTSREQTVCVANTGFHDMDIRPPMSPDLYAQNALWMQHLFLEQHCGIFIWVSINAVTNAKWPQTNDKVESWNAALLSAMMSEEGNSEHPSVLEQGAFFLDIHDKSINSKHVDHVHMDPETFYKPLARFFADMIMKRSRKEESDLSIDPTSPKEPVASQPKKPSSAKDAENGKGYEQTSVQEVHVPNFSSHYCEWTANSSLMPCKQQLLETYPSIQNATHWYFLGDSTVARMTLSFPSTFLDRFKQMRYGKERNKAMYYSNIPAMRSLIPADNPIVANGTLGEGPFPFDRAETACTSCRNRLYRLRHDNFTTNSSPHVAWEFLAMEHNKDRMFQTKQTATSQETLSLYMELSNETTSREQTVCVATTGFHDMGVRPFMQPELYAKNALWMQHLLLERHCGVLVWVSINAVTKAKQSQTNDKVEAWNRALLGAMMSEEGTSEYPSALQQGAFFLDIHDKSKHSEHEDHLHMEPETYYEPLATFFADLILQEESGLKLKPTAQQERPPLESSIPAAVDEVGNGGGATHALTHEIRAPDFPSHYCVWPANGTLQPCKHQLLETFPSIQNATHWFFLGDSTMARMTLTFPPNFKNQFERIRYAHQKVKTVYYSKIPAMRKLIPADDPIPANGALGEGPFPAHYIGTGCTTCRNGLYRQRRNYTLANSPPVAWEFLAIEYSKDRMFQTNQTSTSQETMALYMDLSNETTSREETVCVTTTGFHDMVVQPPMSPHLYAENALWMQHLFLERHCGILLWVSMNAVSTDEASNLKFPQTNEKVNEWNNVLLHAMMSEENTTAHPSVLEQGAFYLDIHDKSKNSKHADHVHMDTETFYEPLSTFFGDLILKR